MNTTPTTKCATEELLSHATRTVYCVLRIVCCVILLTACQFPGSVRPTVKIGLVAPFEGRYRYFGYDVIYAVRLALREANAAGGVAGHYVELVAYDDGADPAQAIEQARKLAVDPAVVAAIGHFREDTTSAALSVYAEVGIPLLAPAVLWSAQAEEQGQIHYPGIPAEGRSVAACGGAVDGPCFATGCGFSGGTGTGGCGGAGWNVSGGFEDCSGCCGGNGGCGGCGWPGSCGVGV